MLRVDRFSDDNLENISKYFTLAGKPDHNCKTTSVFGDKLIVCSFSGIEEISTLYTFNINFFSLDNSLSPEKAIGTNITIEILKESPKFINGIISKFTKGISFEYRNEIFTHYIAEVRPHLWTLSLNNECKIFQEKSALDIIKDVLSKGGIKDVKYSVNKMGKVKREFCVQYNESDFHFISRLMEEEGIFYYFEHTKDKNTLVLSDSSSGYASDKNLSSLQFFRQPPKANLGAHIFSFKSTSFLGTDCYAATDYNFEISTTNLLNKASGKTKKYEFFEYPGLYSKKADGQKLADMVAQGLECDTIVSNGESTVPHFCPGYKMKMENHPDKNFNSEYLVCKVIHQFDALSDGEVYQNIFWNISAKAEFKPIRSTEKPRIYGTQTAVVTGPSGEEIYRDKFGRIKVHFYWDRYNKLDENSSCWIRVAQIWAGNNWGALYTPRIGQEVVINFENGNPDRPIVVGCVYNDKFMPPYPEKEPTKSTIKSASSKGEEGFNEIRFEDLKDKEEIYIHAQKDMNTHIINQRTTLIQESNDLLTLSKGSRSIQINAEGDNPGNLSTTLQKGDISTKIVEGNSFDELTKGNATTTLTEGNMTTTLKKGNASLTLSDGNLSTLLEKGNYDETLKNGDKKVNIKGNKSVSINGNYSISVKGNLTIEVTGNIKLVAKQNINLEGMNVTEKAKTNMTLEAGIAFSAKGTTVAAEAKAAASLKGTATAVEGKAACNVKAPMITVGGGMVQLG